MGFRKVWSQAQGLLVAGYRFRQLSLLDKGHPQVGVRFGNVRFETQGLLVASHRLAHLSLLKKRHSKVAMRFGITRLDAQCLPVAGYRLGQFPLLSEDIRQIVVGFGKVRLDPQGLLVAGHCLRQLFLLCKRHPQVAMRFRIVRSEAQCLADVFDGHVTAARLVGQQAEKMQRPDVPRIHLQDLTVELFRLRQAPPSMVLHGHVEGLSDREHKFPPGAEKPTRESLTFTLCHSPGGRQASGPDDTLKAI